MNTTQPLNKILFLLDEISQAKNRINIATHITRDIEIALLQAKIVELYGEIQQYNHQVMQAPAVQQIPVSHHQPAPVTQPYQAPVKETYTAPKQETIIPEKPAPIAETPKPEPKPFIPEPIVVAEQKPVTPEPVQTQTQAIRKDITDFEKKREKLLREEEEFNAPEPVVNQQYVAPQVQETKQPETIQPQPVEQKPEPTIQQSIAQPEPQPEVQKPEPQPAPEPAKPSVSQLYAQARERAANPGGTEKSLNEKLATQQTSLNDKFQSSVKKNLADKLKLSPISDLRTAININQRVAFINQLFKGDDKEFKNVVGTVNGFKNFSEAKFYIQSDVAPRYNWNENDDNVQEFMELVYRKFL